MKAVSKRSAKTPTRQDLYIGERIREARIAAAMTQPALAELIGVSYQQLQKYENGYCRVNGARIGLLVTALNRPLNYFFPNATDVRAHADPALIAMLTSKDGQALARVYFRIATMSDRRLVYEVAARLAQENPADGQG